MSVQASVLRAIDLMEERLHQPMQIAEAADAAGYSVYHFCRVFNQATRLTPYEYLMRRRLSEAAWALLQTEHKLLDIALDHQFGSGEAFGRAFQRMFAILPSHFRQIGQLDRRRTLPRFTAAYLDALGGLDASPRRLSRPQIDLAGWMVSCMPASIAFSALWRRIDDEIRNAEQGPITDQQAATHSARCGLLYYPHDWQVQGCLSFAGSLAQELKARPDWLANVSIAAQEVASFRFAGAESQLHLILEHIFHTWFPHSRLPQLPNTVMFENEGPGYWSISVPI